MQKRATSEGMVLSWGWLPPWELTAVGARLPLGIPAMLLVYSVSPLTEPSWRLFAGPAELAAESAA
jgi:hypothetical protein